MQNVLIENAWQQKNALYYLVLTPLSWFFAVITTLRRWLFRVGFLKSYNVAVPVIVVGNIHAGGNGKTPVVIYLVEALRKNGFEPAVISRGYGGTAILPTEVNVNSMTANVGDEPVLIANRCQCPVWVGANRVAVANALLQAHPTTNVIISDDGLQHYALKRDIEIAVISPQQHADKLLPAGPLREPTTRLNTVDVILYNGEKYDSKQNQAKAFKMQLIGETFYNLHNPKIKANVADFADKKITAIAGIGQPARFFVHLNKLGLIFNGIGFNDHHTFGASDFTNIDCDALIMTEKDAVKCTKLAPAHSWVLPVEANIDTAFMRLILNKLSKKIY